MIYKLKLLYARHRFAKCLIVLSIIICAVAFNTMIAFAEKIENNVAIFAALDKVTARISKLEVPIGETVAFGALELTPRVCYTRPPTEPPLTSGFVEVHEIKLDDTKESIFKGWMFAQSPGVSGVQHAVFDVWLTDCKMKDDGQSAGR